MTRLVKTAATALTFLLLTATGAHAADLKPDQKVLLQLINEKRAEKGAKPLKWGLKIEKAAMRQSRDLAEKATMTQQSPGNLEKRLKDSGLSKWDHAEENVAGAKTARAAYNVWLKTSGSRTKMLSARHSHVGIGVAETAGGKVYTLDLVQNPRAGATIPEVAKKILSLLNAERAKVGAAPLKWGPKLAVVAGKHSQDMLGKNYFSHKSQDGRTLVDRLREGGVTGWTRAGENIAGTSTGVRAFELWMNSASHHENMLDPKYTTVGIGIATDGAFSMYTMNLTAYPAR